MLNIHLSRRNLLQVGAISTLGLSLESVLRAEQSSSKATKPKQRAKSVVLIFLGGGLSHHDSFDLKPDAPE
jgi:uncharacterized protein (DUF1501 family)